VLAVVVVPVRRRASITVPLEAEHALK